MAGIKEFPNGTFQYVFKKAGLLEKPIYMTFPSRELGDAYAVRLQKLLDEGIIPSEHLPETTVKTIAFLVQEFTRDAHPSDKDREKLELIVREHGTLPLYNITAEWVDGWITTMKREKKRAPSTIRAYVGALARATDWGMRKGYVQMPDHPLRTLPEGYAQYTEADIALAGVERIDEERDRRLEKGEEEKIWAMLNVGVLPRKQRPYVIPHLAAVKMLFTLAVESAMRMREMYTLTRTQVDFAKRTIFLDKTKNGDKRQVPMSSVVVRELDAYIENAAIKGDEIIFPFWDGSFDKQVLKRTSSDVSELYERIFLAAGCEDLTFHDLRHEATSRLFERTTMVETKIMKITGHKSRKMMLRYANLRGSSLADELW